MVQRLEDHRVSEFRLSMRWSPLALVAHPLASIIYRGKTFLSRHCPASLLPVALAISGPRRTVTALSGGSSMDDTCINTTEAKDLAQVVALIPELSFSARKGQMGRIAVLGGSADYTGAPYYAAISSLKVGADLSFVLTAEEAVGPIKCYSPELMVTPVYSAKALDEAAQQGPEASGPLIDAMVNKVCSFLPRLHVLVVGPGLGRNGLVLGAVGKVLLEARNKDVPVVIDADGLWLVAKRPELVRGNRRVILTPNAMEFARLEAGLMGTSVEEAIPSKTPPNHDKVMEVAAALGHVTVMLKGREDIISDGHQWVVSTETGAMRRSGGLGDILAGTTGVMVHWAMLTAGKEASPLWACFAASTVVRLAGTAAFADKKRSMTAPDVIEHLGGVLEKIKPSNGN